MGELETTWAFTVVLLVLQTWILCVTGECKYEGQIFQAGASWKSRDCRLQCACDGSNPVCQPLSCVDPGCDFRREVLSITKDDSCCPTCGFQSKHCKYQGKFIEEGVEWNTSSCEICNCQSGIVSCKAPNCPSLQCPPNYVSAQIRDECCPQCMPDKNWCMVGGLMYKNEDTWISVDCTICQCKNGAEICYIATCPALVCAQDEVLKTPSGGCCPECMKYQCKKDDMSYQEGDTWWTDPCAFCICLHSGIVCHQQNCSSHETCILDKNAAKREDKCCSSCAPVQGSCTESGKVYLSGEIWKSDDCEFCICEMGKILCQSISCLVKKCLKGEVQVQKLGKCCPECVAPLQNCISDQGIQESGSTWQIDACTLCRCNDGKVTCYSEKCIHCSEFETTIPVAGKCCPSCLPNLCGAGCQTCLESNPEYCTECVDLHHVLQDGKCTAHCNDGYYSNEKRHCKSCHSLCETCFGGLQSQCFSCKAGHFLRKGYCVDDCGFNYFAKEEICSECHPSCSQCQGPGENDCLSCNLPGQLIENGYCTDECQGHTYVSDGYCFPCNESCARCLTDGSCLFCPEELYLEGRFCVPFCNSGHYIFMDAYCLPCHPNCQQCYGPLPFQCVGCSYTEFLLDGSCVEDCGQGYYGDQGAGVCMPCHSECRSCLGGARNDQCLSCASGSLLPHPGTSYGKCVKKCPLQYFSTDTGICHACHDMCLSCFGPDDTDCVSCNSTYYLKSGKCVPHCSVGYFMEDETCHACHPSCSTCYGWAADECYTCPSGKTADNGRCSTNCEAGKFMDFSGVCQQCHQTCAACIANTSYNALQCVECKHQQHYIFGEECIPECEHNYFVNTYRACEACHNSCASCERAGTSGCASCWNISVLTHIGTCNSHCHPGYYAKDGICQACDSTCYHCVAEGRCVQCKGELVLHFGECVSQCMEQHFVDPLTHQCRECHWECNTCIGPSSSNCTSCMLGTFLQAGECVQNCDEGYYLDEEECMLCDLKCKTCSSASRCTSCELPLFLLNDECVVECGIGKFSDFSSFTCLVCPDNCAFCITPNECGLCETGFHLHQSLCVFHCPRGHFADSYLRICERNIYPPRVIVNNTLFVEAGSVVSINSSFLNAYDEDTDPQNLIFTIVEKPQNGAFIKMLENGTETSLNKGQTFRISDLTDGWIFFRHFRKVPLSGQLVIKVMDRQLESPSVAIPFQVISPYPPVVEQKKPFIVKGDQLEVMDPEVLNIFDRDNVDDVSIKILKGPFHGMLVEVGSEKPISKITANEILQGQVAYKYKKQSNNFQDSVILQATDGYHYNLEMLKIFVISQDSKGPALITNTPAYVQAGGSVTLTTQNLLAVGKGLNPSDILFMFEPLSKIHVRGYFFKVKELKDIYSLPEKHGKVTTFTLDDINKNLISFQHVDLQTTEMSLKFKVVSIKDQRRRSLSHNFKIHVLSRNFTSPLLPHSKRYGIMVLENHPATISNSHLTVVDSGFKVKNVLYTITKPLMLDQGTIEHEDNRGVPISSFTQSDVESLKIIYRPPTNPIQNEKQYTFHFSVSDSQSGFQLYPEQEFTISIVPMSGTASASSPEDHGTSMVVNQGHTVHLNPNVLSTKGHLIPENQLEVMLTKAPLHGILVQGSGSDEIELEEGDASDFASVVHNLFYRNDGSNNLKDSAVFTIMGGSHSTQSRLNIEIKPNDTESPVILDSTTLMGKVKEGEFFVIQRNHLAYTDAIANDNTIVFTLLNTPKYGNLEILTRGKYEALKPKSAFLQQNIDDSLIRYKAKDNIGLDAVKESIHFNVTDDNGNVRPDQVFMIKINPRVRLPPVATVLRNIVVEEGGDALFNSKIISVSDPDSPNSDLLVVLDKQPTHGFLENSRPIPQREKSLEGIPVSSFAFNDVLEGYIKYTQSSFPGMEPEWDSFFIHINDGHLVSSSHQVNVTIKPINDEEPIILSEPLFVPRGGVAKITNSTLSAFDADNSPYSLTFTLEVAPMKGHIRKLGTPNSKSQGGKILHERDDFVLQDIMTGLLIFAHDEPKEMINDSFQVSVSDGLFLSSGTIDVIIFESDRQAPFLDINRGLEIQAGTTAVISSKILHANDKDSEEESLLFQLSSNPTAGKLFITKSDYPMLLSVSGLADTFSQTDVNLGLVTYVHDRSEPTGIQFFKFNVKDPIGNALIDQKFIITVFDNVLPPVVTKNTGLSVTEGTSHLITTSNLYVEDLDSAQEDLTFFVISSPTLGHLELIENKGKEVREFKLLDLISSNVRYVHTSETENHLDNLIFDVSDGRNKATQAFYITIIPVDDSLPHVTVKRLKVAEGKGRIISEFELRVQDADTKDSSIIININTAPVYGTLFYDKYNGGYPNVSNFTMEDIYRGKIMYLHGGSDTVKDSFRFTVSDGANPEFVFINKNNVTTSRPVVFQIEILPVDDGVPVLITNYGLQYLITTGEQYWNEINNQTLLTKDVDTEPRLLVYVITQQPKLGVLELKSHPREKLNNFTQGDVNEGLLRYILMIDDSNSVEDSFVFSVQDSKPVLITGNVFPISWSRVHFSASTYNVTENEGLLNIKVIKTGNTDTNSHVKCRIQLSSPRKTAALEDLVLSTPQVSFEMGEKEKFCSIQIKDDGFHEGREVFTATLSDPFHALLGTPSSVFINVYDDEDEPTIEFPKAIFYVNETQNYLYVPVVRRGDLSKHVTVICSTSSLAAKGNSQKGLETGSDFRTRFLNGASEITFPPGVEQTTCDVRIIDDSFYEDEEDFELILSDPFPKAKIGSLSKARIVVIGPNDEPQVYLSYNKYKFQENVGDVRLEIIRSGPDLSHLCIVWCGARPSMESSAIAGQDFLPSSTKITFEEGKTSAECPITILDDILDPKVEGNEEFVVFLSSPLGCTLGEPSMAVITVEDEEMDVPCVQFGVSSITVKETSGKIDIPIRRIGDLEKNSAVRCITKSDSATVDEDFVERINTDVSAIVFLSGERETFCSVNIIDDLVFEGKEYFQVKLVEANLDKSHKMKIGSKNMVILEIIDKEDAVVVELEKPLYIIKRPNSPFPAKLTISVVRKGDLNQVSKVRLSTQDGSALSGIDFYAKSKVLEFSSGQAVQDFETEILYNKKRKWNLSFSIVLSSDELVNAELGNITRTSVTISGSQTTGSWILPAVPLVISLQYYDNVEQGIKIRPSTGYPLVCVTPCDSRYPDYISTAPLCEEAAINMSALYFSWEIAMPLDSDGSMSSFEMVTDSTLFTSAHHAVLDSIYFRRHEHVRCVVQARDLKGNLGVSLRSSAIQISPTNGICDTPLVSGYPHSVLQSQSFVASLNYVDPKDKEHPNRIHIHVEIPHQDGMLPLISTFPLHNIQFLLTQTLYKQQHICSNLLFTTAGDEEHSTKGFLGDLDFQFSPVGLGYNLPHQFDTNLRENRTVLLYQHLNLKSCTWTFDAWYHMTELIDLCGGTTTSDFKARDSDETFLTVHLPLHVSYVFAAAPTGWTSVEHRTEMEVSFFYNSVQWHKGLQVDETLSASLQVLRLGINANGQMYFEFKTEAKFRGLYVLDHHTLPGIKSHVVPPSDLSVHFELSLLWSERTYDGPSQLWKATSKYNLKDYSGLYAIMLIPCKVASIQVYSYFNGSNIPCGAQHPQRFEIPLSFQQTSRPVPVMYSLNTIFQLLNGEKSYLLDPSESTENIQYMDYKGSFSKGQTVYGRVLWSPEQNLESAYELKINRVIICTGIDGYTPTYDPTGDIYGEGPEYGCIQPDKNLKHKFIILDRSNPSEIHKSYHDVQFEATFSDNGPGTNPLSALPGVDGFQFKVDALYEVNSGHQWFLQVMYTIGPSNRQLSRLRRSLWSQNDQHDFHTSKFNFLAGKKYGSKSSLNGTNIHAILLDNSHASFEKSEEQERTDEHSSRGIVHIVLPTVFIGVILIVALALLLLRLKTVVQDRNYESDNRKNFKKLSKRNKAFACDKSYGRSASEMVLKDSSYHSSLCRVKLAPTKSKIQSHLSNSIGTEV